ncbi:MAG: biliverdin-producing heme oxygenase [Planctomycetota bacterium]|nr:biliverdin-producing heme oxygenase [Planctomycetota bacterium]
MHATSASIMSRLREETAELHSFAESRPLQRAMATGKLTLGQYTAYLVQLRLVHRALDGALERLRDQDQLVREIVSVEQFMSEHVEADLRYFGVRFDEVPPVPSTRVLIDRIGSALREAPLAVLGHHYVTLGSSNGGRFIARPVRRAFNLTNEGVRSLDPWGEGQTAIWGGFKQAMDAAEFPLGVQTAIVASAREMFEGIAGISDEVWERAAV